MAHVTTTAVDPETARPFGISREMRALSANYVVELRDGGLVGRGEAAPNPRFGEGREEGEGLLVDLAPEIADAEGPAAVETACACRGVPVLLGCMVESSLGVAAALQLAGLVDHVDLDGALLLARDPFTGIETRGDVLSATDAPGLGVRPVGTK